jgi:hypothetical protein
MFSQKEQNIDHELAAVKQLKVVMKRYGIRHCDLSDACGVNIESIRKVMQYDKRYYGTESSVERLNLFIASVDAILRLKRDSVENDLVLLSRLKSPLCGHEEGGSESRSC